MVLEESNIEGILDWESARFYLQYWITSKPIRNAGFYLKSIEGTKREAWRDFLRSMLEKESFESALAQGIGIYKLEI